MSGIDLKIVLWAFAAFVAAGVISFATTPIVKTLAHKVGAIDVPKDERRMHSSPIPRMGGLAIFLGFLLSVLVFVPIGRQMQGILLGSHEILSQLAPDDLGAVFPQPVDTTGIKGFHAPGAGIALHGLAGGFTQGGVIAANGLQLDDQRRFAGIELQNLTEGGNGFLCALQMKGGKLLRSQIFDFLLHTCRAQQGMVMDHGEIAVFQ